MWRSQQGNRQLGTTEPGTALDVETADAVAEIKITAAECKPSTRHEEEANPTEMRLAASNGRCDDGARGA